MSKSVLVILAPGFEEIEAIAPVDILRRAGAEVTLASLDGADRVEGKNAIVVEVDSALDAVADRPFDALMLPGGPGTKQMRADGRPARLARVFAEQGRLVAAICAAPLVLKDAGLLPGPRFTAHASTEEELPELLPAERVVRDGRIITSRGAGTAVEFGLALVEDLCGAQLSADLARSIHHRL